MFPMADKNTLFYGDNIDVLPRIASESVDLIYMDPPFKSDKQYNVLFRTVTGDPSPAQIHAFDDTWQWSIEAEATYQAMVATGGSETVTFLRAMFQVLGKSDVMAYLVMMAPRLIEMRRVMKPTASIYLHCDPTASHYLKLLMDAVFTPDQFRNEVIWLYKTGGASKRWFARKHDTLLFYSKTKDYLFNPLKEKSYLSHKYGFKNVEILQDDGGYYTNVNMRDVWDIPALRGNQPETLGYPTQKPLALLERVISASSNPGDVVLDPFCGCGTAIDAAQSLDRRWLGIDVAYIAVDLIRNRLVGRYGKDILSTFDTDGIPKDIEGANALADRNKIDFERWAVSLVNGQPTKASGDEGIDGKIYFAKTYKEPLDVGVCAVSVKGGANVNPGMVRDLAGTVSGSDSQMGLLILRVPPTAGMESEAAKHATYIHEATGTLYPKIQMMTVAELLEGKQPQIPSPLPPYQQASWAAASVAVPLF
jgi:site-specific DNA-methyltransferase (adenine-specific)